MIFESYAVLASFLGTSVEFIEALTIILAVGTIRGWKSSLSGAAAAIIILTILVAGIGTSLVQIVHIFWVQLLVGLFMLLFGIRWLRKAILRYSGLKAIHDEAESYQSELERQKKAGNVGKGIDSFGFMTSLSITFLEGMEAIFIVITLGTSSTKSGLMQNTIIGALAAVVVVLLAGLLLRQPLIKIPENTMKFIVGVMLTSFGAFWVGEAFEVQWPQSDLSIVYLSASLLVFSWLTVRYIKSKLKQAKGGKQNESTINAMGVNR
ncbi:COG4280 domain-containing protein [Metabacillus sp. RGM 3146]|uniref:COG4280 domain-containing protein n=1 Tax=Metabacillus sp. RGM 3146 TaxID=3401092 RepID=UPI003B9D8D0D